MTIRRATADEIEKSIRPFTGSTGGGQWSFQLTCRYCRDLGTVSAASHSISNPRHIRKAAQKFVSQGWWWLEGEAVCPLCYKRKHFDELP